MRSFFLFALLVAAASAFVAPAGQAVGKRNCSSAGLGLMGHRFADIKFGWSRPTRLLGWASVNGPKWHLIEAMLSGWCKSLHCRNRMSIHVERIAVHISYHSHLVHHLRSSVNSQYPCRPGPQHDDRCLHHRVFRQQRQPYRYQHCW